MARISFMVVEKTLYQTTAYCNFRNDANIKQKNRLKSRCHTLMSQAFYFIHFFKLLQFVWIGKGKYSFYGPFLKSQYLRKTMKREYRHLWIIHEMICVMNNKTNINFYWVKHSFSFLNKSTYFLILGKVVFILKT